MLFRSSGLIGLNKGGDINIESYSRGNNFSSYNNVNVPISNVSLTISYSFGNSKKQAQQHVSRVQNDFIEMQSQGEVINSIGSSAQ